MPLHLLSCSTRNPGDTPSNLKSQNLILFPTGRNLVVLTDSDLEQLSQALFKIKLPLDRLNRPPRQLPDEKLTRKPGDTPSNLKSQNLILFPTGRNLVVLTDSDLEQLSQALFKVKLPLARLNRSPWQLPDEKLTRKPGDTPSNLKSQNLIMFPAGLSLVVLTDNDQDLLSQELFKIKLPLDQLNRLER